MASDRMQNLQNLYDKYLVDERFAELRKPGINFVPGAGPLEPKLMIVGEAPGAMENARRVPFIGVAGNNLNSLLAEVEIDPYETFMTNIVKYWPTEPNESRNITRTPSDEEISISREYLLEEVKIVNPSVVALCGASALKGIYPDKTPVWKSHGQIFDDKFVSVYHPSLISYDPGKKEVVKSGFVLLKSYMDRAN